MDLKRCALRNIVRMTRIAVMAAGLAGCSRAGTALTSVGSETALSSAANSSPAATVRAEAGSEYYVVPAPVRTQDGTLYSRQLGASNASDVLIAVGTDATFVPASSGTAIGHLQWLSSATQTVAFGSPAAGSVETVGNMGIPLTSLIVGSLIYAQVDATVVAFSNGAVESTYPLPTLQPDPTVGGFPVGYKGAFGGLSSGQVSALVPSADGHVLAFTSTGLASAVTDLMTGKTTLLGGYGTLGSAVRTPMGSIDVLAWRGYQSDYALHVVSLDGISLGVVASIETSVFPAGYLRDRLVSEGSYDAVLSVAAGDETSGVTLSVFSVQGSSVTQVAVSKGTGLEIAAGPAGTVYEFGGPATNTVNQLDLATGVLTHDLPSLRAPAGAYIVGIGAS